MFIPSVWSVVQSRLLEFGFKDPSGYLTLLFLVGGICERVWGADLFLSFVLRDFSFQTPLDEDADCLAFSPELPPSLIGSSILRLILYNTYKVQKHNIKTIGVTIIYYTIYYVYIICKYKGFNMYGRPTCCDNPNFSNYYKFQILHDKY